MALSNIQGFVSYEGTGTDQNYYWTTANTDGAVLWITTGGTITSYDSGLATTEVKLQNGPGLNPLLYFKYVKNKFKLLERKRMDGFIARLTKAYTKAHEAGLEVLSKKVMTRLAIATREAPMFAKGVKYYIERDDLERHRHKVRGGKISDTKLKEYTRVIPDRVLAEKKRVEECFDDFVIYHYWNEAEQKDVKKMDPEEKAKMKDPILFGIVKETNRLYFIADWDDEYCDLTFDELVDVIAKEDDRPDEAFEIKKDVQLT